MKKGVIKWILLCLAISLVMGCQGNNKTLNSAEETENKSYVMDQNQEDNDVKDVVNPTPSANIDEQKRLNEVEPTKNVACGRIYIDNKEFMLKLVKEETENTSFYALCLYNLDGSLLSTLNIDTWSEPLRFDDTFDILSADYDDNGTPEILIGQYGCQNWNLYHMYTVSNDFIISEMENVPELTISEKEYSIILEKSNNTLLYSYYDNSKSEWVKKELEIWP